MPVSPEDQAAMRRYKLSNPLATICEIAARFKANENSVQWILYKYGFRTPGKGRYQRQPGKSYGQKPDLAKHREIMSVSRAHPSWTQLAVALSVGCSQVTVHDVWEMEGWERKFKRCVFCKQPSQRHDSRTCWHHQGWHFCEVCTKPSRTSRCFRHEATQMLATGHERWEKEPEVKRRSRGKPDKENL